MNIKEFLNFMANRDFVTLSEGRDSETLFEIRNLLTQDSLLKTQFLDALKKLPDFFEEQKGDEDAARFIIKLLQQNTPHVVVDDILKDIMNDISSSKFFPAEDFDTRRWPNIFAKMLPEDKEKNATIIKNLTLVKEKSQGIAAILAGAELPLTQPEIQLPNIKSQSETATAVYDEHTISRYLDKFLILLEDDIHYTEARIKLSSSENLASQKLADLIETIKTDQASPFTHFLLRVAELCKLEALTKAETLARSLDPTRASDALKDEKLLFEISTSYKEISNFCKEKIERSKIKSYLEEIKQTPDHFAPSKIKTLISTYQILNQSYKKKLPSQKNTPLLSTDMIWMHKGKNYFHMRLKKTMN